MNEFLSQPRSNIIHEDVSIVISEEIDQLVTIHHEAINQLEGLRSALYKDWRGLERLGAVNTNQNKFRSVIAQRYNTVSD